MRLGFAPTKKKARARRLRHEMTTAELVLWNELRRGQLGVRFHRQQVVRGYIVDFYAPAARLVVEVDGPVHDERARYDHVRDRVMALLGLDVLRFANDHVIDDLPSAVAAIRDAVVRNLAGSGTTPFAKQRGI